MRATFGLLDGADIPPVSTLRILLQHSLNASSQFISIHARHGDFKAQCPDLPLDRCFTPLAVWKKHVDVLRAELREQKGVDVVHVVMLSDEQDDSWWAEIVKMGWYRVDHVKMRTEETYGKWCVVDCILSTWENLIMSALQLFFQVPGLYRRRYPIGWQGLPRDGNLDLIAALYATYAGLERWDREDDYVEQAQRTSGSGGGVVREANYLALRVVLRELPFSSVAIVYSNRLRLARWELT